MAKSFIGNFLVNYLNKLGNLFSFGALKKMGAGIGLGNVAESLVNKTTGAGLTGAEREANQFSHEEAELAYERQREFYTDFQSPEAMIRQYRDAGLNPALMYGNGSSSSGVIGSSAPSSVSPSSGEFGQLISLMANLGFRAQEVKAEKLLKESQSSYFSALAKSTENENSVFAEKYGFWKSMQSKTLEQMDADILLKNMNTRLAEQGINESEARSTLLHYQGLIAKQDASDQKRMNQILYEVRQSAKELNEATAFNATSQGLESQQRLDEAKKTFETRFNILQETLRKAASDAGISQNEFMAFWGDKRLHELLTISEVFENYKTEFRAFGIGGSGSSWIDRLSGSASNVYGLPALSPPSMF